MLKESLLDSLEEERFSPLSLEPLFGLLERFSDMHQAFLLEKDTEEHLRQNFCFELGRQSALELIYFPAKGEMRSDSTSNSDREVLTSMNACLSPRVAWGQQQEMYGLK